MSRLSCVLVALVLLLSGCAGRTPPPATPPVTSAATPEPPQTQAAGSAQTTDFDALLPAPDKSFTLTLADGTRVKQQYIRDGNRLIGSSDGKTSDTWFITEQGVWRFDPERSALLRYLPPSPEHLAAWKQTVAGADVWFMLRSKECSLRPCWELTILDGLNRTLVQFGAREGYVITKTENLQSDQSVGVERLEDEGAADGARREQLLQEGARLPDGPLPAVTEVSPEQFDAALRAALQRADRPFVDVDLDGDGRFERIEGRLGEWHDRPLSIDTADRGNADPFLGWYGSPHRLELVRIAGMDRPALIFQVGTPDRWHELQLYTWVNGKGVPFCCGYPFHTESGGAGVTVTAEGLVEVAKNPQELGGYRWIRRYRPIPSGEQGRYASKLESDVMEPGPYPTEPERLLVAAFIANWFGFDRQLAAYIPDAAVRERFLAAKIPKPTYGLGLPGLGKLIPGKPGPTLEPAPVDASGEADFLLIRQGLEGYSWHGGEVTFARALEDGRLIIRAIDVSVQGGYSGM